MRKLTITTMFAVATVLTSPAGAQSEEATAAVADPATEAVTEAVADTATETVTEAMTETPAAPAEEVGSETPVETPTEAEAITDAPVEPVAQTNTEAAVDAAAETEAATETTTEPSATESSVSATVTPEDAPAGAKIERSGFYLGLGAALGASGLADDSIGGTPLSGTFNLRTGVAIMDQYLIGVHAVFLGQYHEYAEKSPVGGMLSSFMAEIMTFPLAHLPLNVATGVGWGSAVKLTRLADSGGGNPKVVAASGNGVSWMGAVGWDFGAGVGTNLGLQLRYDGVNSSSLGTDHTGSLAFWLNFY